MQGSAATPRLFIGIFLLIVLFSSILVSGRLTARDEAHFDMVYWRAEGVVGFDVDVDLDCGTGCGICWKSLVVPYGCIAKGSVRVYMPLAVA